MAHVTDLAWAICSQICEMKIALANFHHAKYNYSRRDNNIDL